MPTFQFFFFKVQGTGGSPTRSYPENRVGDQDTGSTGDLILRVLICIVTISFGVYLVLWLFYPVLCLL